MHLRRQNNEGRHVLSDDDLELIHYDAECEQRYLTMTGMDQPLDIRAKVARYNAESTPFAPTKTW